MPSQLQKARNFAYQQQAGLCHYCKACMWLGDIKSALLLHGMPRQKAPLLECTAEHLDPKSTGGPDSRPNIVAACRFCNEMRHRVETPPPPDVYQRVVGRLVTEGRWHSRQGLSYLRTLLGAASSDGDLDPGAGA